MSREPAVKAFPGFAYFTYTGFVIAVILGVTYIGHLQQRPWALLLVRDVVVVLTITAALAGVAFALTRQKLRSALSACGAYLQARTFRSSTIGLGVAVTFDRSAFTRAVKTIYGRSKWFATVCYLSVAFWLLSSSHRRYFFVVGILQACAMCALRRPPSVRAGVAFLLLGLSTWALSTGLTYTNFGDWELNSVASSLAVAAFVFSFAVVLLELCDERLGRSWDVKSLPALSCVLLILVAFACRSDNMLDTWIPYHRSFVADIAQLVRDGHWVLWDFPSQYGLLSVVAIAAVPAKNAWQGLFILVAAFSVVQSFIVFSLWRWGRAGWGNLLFSALVTLAAFGDSISRYPLDGRLYPAQGLLRSMWVLCLLMTVFLLYVWRERPRRVKALFCVGHLIWAISLLWSFEVAIWSTLVWVPYVLLSASTSLSHASFRDRMIRYAWPLIALPVACIAGVEFVYRVALGHGPDWFAYVEFTGFFLAGANNGNFPENPYGAGWCIVLMLGACGAVVLAAIRQARWATVPLLVATALAVVAASTSYAVEPFDGRVAWTLCIDIAAVAIVTYVSRSELRDDSTALFARLSMAPVMIVCMTIFLGSPSHFATMTFPFMRGWTSDTLSTMPAIHGELANLIRRARIEPGSALLIPSRPYWTEISQGILFPTAYVEGRGVIAYRSWVPLSPLGIGLNMQFLPAPRRQLYIDRYLDRSTSAGWYVEYRAPASCEAISQKLFTERTVLSPNYSASLCRVRTELRRPASARLKT